MSSLRTATDELNLVSRTCCIVRSRYPDEPIQFATAVTILETPHEAPTGWSLRRFFQRRGNVVITNARVFVQASFLSIATILFVALLVFSAYQYSQNGRMLDLAFAILAAGFLVQRRPYARDLPFAAIRRVQFGTVHGIASRHDILSLSTGNGAIQLVTSQNLPEEVRAQLMALSAERNPA